MFWRVFFTLLGATAVIATRCNKFYRKDYTYIDQFDAFYKLHWEQPGRWQSAFLACDDEGATFFYPKTAEERTVVKRLVGMELKSNNVTEIFVGIHDEFGFGEFMTVDGKYKVLLHLIKQSPRRVCQPASSVPGSQNQGQSMCVAMGVDTGTYILTSCETEKPFLCKKVEEAVPSCPTVDRGYTYHSDVKKCYKINQRKKSWAEAMKTCITEGGVLAVAKNNAEADIIYREMKEHFDEPYFVGFRRLQPQGDFYTVKG
ncbi:C-type mannose receptor 2-like [Cydia splendana]|uniref:C-type mannose receptor 2-like n=1 Tax=Cydia splendana TaxID=1100963 RepID=UPI00300DB64B